LLQNKINPGMKVEEGRLASNKSAHELIAVSGVIILLLLMLE
jgi:hypothetical protein